MMFESSGLNGCSGEKSSEGNHGNIDVRGENNMKHLATHVHDIYGRKSFMNKLFIKLFKSLYYIDFQLNG